jgi:hypothetical protein
MDARAFTLNIPHYISSRLKASRPSADRGNAYLIANLQEKEGTLPTSISKQKKNNKKILPERKKARSTNIPKEANAEEWKQEHWR